MSITIGQRVKRCVDYTQQGEFEFALEQVSIAIDLTSQRYYGEKRSKASLYKQFLKKYSWMLELMAFININLDDSKFGNYPLQDFHKPDRLHKEPTFQDICYDVIRGGLIHDEGVPSNIRFTDEDHFGMGDKFFLLPKKIIWGFLGAVVFCPTNKQEKTADDYYLSIFNEKFIINDSWGREELARNIYDKNKDLQPRIALNIPYDHFNS